MWANLNDNLGSIPLPADELVEMPPEAHFYQPRPEHNDMVLGTPSKVDLSALHPNPVQVSRLWQIFLTYRGLLICHVPLRREFRL